MIMIGIRIKIWIGVWQGCGGREGLADDFVADDGGGLFRGVDVGEF